MTNLNYKQLRELFLNYLNDKGITIFKYSLLKQWFMEYKLRYSPTKFDNPNVHRLILRELQKEGKVVQIRKNLWQVVFNPGVHKMHQELLNPKQTADEDEFDKYLREKLTNLRRKV